jgi:hypothetical protein
MDTESKEIMKSKFKFSQVPFCIVVSKVSTCIETTMPMQDLIHTLSLPPRPSQDRRVVAQGPPKDIDLPAAIARAIAIAGPSQEPASTLVLDEDF